MTDEALLLLAMVLLIAFGLLLYTMSGITLVPGGFMGPPR